MLVFMLRWKTGLMVKATWWFPYYKTQRLCLTGLSFMASAAINAVETLTLRGSSLGFWHTPCPGSLSAPFIVFLSTYFTCLSSFSWMGDPPGSVSGFLFLSLFTHSSFSHLSLIWWLQLSLRVESHSENCQLLSTSTVLATFTVSSHWSHTHLPPFRWGGRGPGRFKDLSKISQTTQQVSDTAKVWAQIFLARRLMLLSLLCPS